MKKLLAVLLCLVLLTVPASAAGASGKADRKPAPGIPAANKPAFEGGLLTIDQVAVTLNDQTFEPEITACLEAGLWQEKLSLFASVNYEGEELLPVLLGMNAQGMYIALGDSQLYVYTPEFFEDMFGVPGTAAAFPEVRFEPSDAAPPPDLSALAFAFADMLDQTAGDEFPLDIPRTAQWLEEKLNLKPGVISQNLPEDLPPVTVSRESYKYLFTIGAEDPEYLTLTRTDDLISVKNADRYYPFGAQFHADGAVQITYGTGEAYAVANGAWISFKFGYEPGEAGGGDFSFSCDLYEYGRTLIYIEGTVNADGTSESVLTVSDEALLLGVPVSVSCRIRDEKAEVSDRTAGRRERIIDEDSDEAYTGIALAAIGLMGDLERLSADETVLDIVQAYDDAWEAELLIYTDPEYSKDDLSFPVPEFTSLPEGFELTDEYYSYGYCSLEYAGASGDSLTIVLQEDYAPSDTYVYTPGEGLFPVEGIVAEFYRDDGGYSRLSLTEGNVVTSIYTYGFELTLEEAEDILEGRVWP